MHPCVSRSMETPKIAELWQALRVSGLESLAPTLVQLRVRSLDDVTCRVTELSDAGVLQWQIEAIIAARGKEEPQRLETSAGRSDHPVPFAGRRASLAAALEAAQPNNRKRSLATLDADILAKSTTPSQERSAPTGPCVQPVRHHLQQKTRPRSSFHTEYGTSSFTTTRGRWSTAALGLSQCKKFWGQSLSWPASTGNMRHRSCTPQ